MLSLTEFRISLFTFSVKLSVHHRCPEFRLTWHLELSSQYSFIAKFILKGNYSISYYCNFPLKWIFTRWILCRLKNSKWLKVLINFSGDLKHTGKVPGNLFPELRVLHGWSLDQGRYFSGSNRARWIEQNQLVVSIL